MAVCSYCTGVERSSGAEISRRSEVPDRLVLGG